MGPGPADYILEISRITILLVGPPVLHRSLV